jgi:hypothetical protein
MRNSLYILLIISLCQFSCSSYYHSVGNDQIIYDHIESDSSGIVILHSDHNHPIISENVKQERRTRKAHLIFIPVRIINQSADDYTISLLSLDIINNYEKNEVLFFPEYYRYLKYRTYLDLSWFVGGLLGSVSISSNGTKFNYLSPTLLLIIPGSYYFTRALKSNKGLKEDLLKNDLMGSTIKPQSMKDGFICIKADQVNNLSIQIKK